MKLRGVIADSGRAAHSEAIPWLSSHPATSARLLAGGVDVIRGGDLDDDDAARRGEQRQCI